MEVHAAFIFVFVCFFLVLENLGQTTVTRFGALESEPDFLTPEFVSTAAFS